MDKTTGRADARQDGSVSHPHVLTELLAMSGRLAVLEAERASGVQAFRAIFERMTVAIERLAAFREPEPEIPEEERKRLTPVERQELIQRACQMLPDWKANTSAIARELGVSRKLLERSPLYQRARAIECSINPEDYRD